MPDRFTDQQLDAVLGSVGRHLVIPAPAAGVPTFTAREYRRRPARTARLVAAAAVRGGPPRSSAWSSRRSGTRWPTGSASAPRSIERVQGPDGDPRGLPSLAAGAVPVSPAAARAELGRPVPRIGSALLGRPTLRALPQEGGVLLVWPRGQTTLWVRADAGEGVPVVKKLLNVTDRVTPIAGLGEMAAIVEGAHVLETPTRRVSAGRVLLWVEDGLEYRLESDLPRSELVKIARSVSAASR